MIPTIKWDKTPRKIAADPAATVALDRSGWQAAGATFAQFEDELGRTPAVATARLKAGHDSTDIGVLDYGEDSTFLLIHSRGKSRQAVVLTALSTLAADKALKPSDVLELLPTADAGTDFQDLLARQVAEIKATRKALAQPKTPAPELTTAGISRRSPAVSGERPSGLKQRSYLIGSDEIRWLETAAGKTKLTQSDLVRLALQRLRRDLGAARRLKLEGVQTLAKGTAWAPARREGPRRRAS